MKKQLIGPTLSATKPMPICREQGETVSRRGRERRKEEIRGRTRPTPPRMLATISGTETVSDVESMLGTVSRT